MSQIRPNNAYLGLNLDALTGQVKPGQLGYAKNAVISGYDGNMISYQNELGNELCFSIPEGYRVIGTHNIVEKSTIILFLVNPTSSLSEIGKVQGCQYSTVINAACLNFNINYPILKAVHKITNCSTEVYWTDGLNPMRYIDLDNLPYAENLNGCEDNQSTEIDCNKMRIMPNFAIPEVEYRAVRSDGTITAGTYQFAFQYATPLGEAYTSFYSITNPIPVFDPLKVTPDFNYQVGKSIELTINNIDTTGLYEYFNIAVIKTINNIPSVDLVGTFPIQSATQNILYTGQSKAGITLNINDIFERFPIYETADDITAVNDILVFKGMTTTERLNYQQIARHVKVQWVSWKLPPDQRQYKDELNAAKVRGYMRDEVYPFDLVFILKNGYQTDRFPLIGRAAVASDLEITDNADVVQDGDVCDEPEPKRRWQVYNTASVLGTDPGYNPDDPCYQGPYQYGEFAYWESTETYPCNEAVWGDLQGQPIRHFKFPDNAISNHHDDEGNIYPLGIRIDMLSLQEAIRNSSLSEEQKNNIAAVKIVRGNRANAKSVVAKGLLFNVGQYTKQTSQYFYPNYPFNDLRPDPFISNSSTGLLSEQIFGMYEPVQSVGISETNLYLATIVGDTLGTDNDKIVGTYRGTFGGTSSKKRIRVYFDTTVAYDSGQLTVDNTNSWLLTVTAKRVNAARIELTSRLQVLGGFPRIYTGSAAVTDPDFSIDHTLLITGQVYDFPNIGTAQDGDITGNSADVNYIAAPTLITSANLLDGFSQTASRMRYTFHSPDTAFYQPFLGTQLKLETVEFGATRSHFVQVKGHSKYRFPSLESYLTALGVGIAIGFASGMYGVSTQPFDGGAAFTAFTILEDVIFKLLPKKNMAYQFNSVGNYTDTTIVPNDVGEKIRRLDIAAYLAPGMQGVGDEHIVNNYQRESSVYLRTTAPLPYPDTLPGVPQDNSRFTLGEVGCQDRFYSRDISAYYGSIKVPAPDQYGQIYSYDAIDTGFQFLVDAFAEFAGPRYRDVFGGDTFINKFALKRKLPFFIDNRVGFPDESDVFYDELGNIGFPRYWFSTDIRRGDGGGFGIGSLFGVKVNNFDCENSAFFYDAGKIYLFAYGIINFYVESQVNVDYRQAINAQEGDFYPHVGTDVPDDWLQENFVPIVQDNTYVYNKTFSKQNLENVFSTLPVNFVPGQDCKHIFPNKAIFSERQVDVVNYVRNNWLVYRPAAFFDFPLNYGRLISLDGLETRQVLARFENKMQLYNALLTAQTSIGDVYLGQPLFTGNVPPVDFAETDTGYAGSQHKFLLKTEYGHFTIDAKRGHVFLVTGSQLINLGNEGISRFLTNNLPFQIQKAFPEYKIDNHFKGVGLHGVYDTHFDRIIITKLDYRPLNSSIIYDFERDIFTLNGLEVSLTDPTMFCNTSFTLSYWIPTKAWVAFHSYLPNFYIQDIGKFYSSSPDLGSAWTHNTIETLFNNFYGEVHPYVLDYPLNYNAQDEILQSVKDYTKVNRITNRQSFVQTDDIYFNKAILYNDQQCSGIRNLVPKPKNNLSAYLQYPRINGSAVDILVTKSDNFYNYNGIWDVVQDYDEPIWLTQCENLSDDKVLNQANMDYSVRSFRKYPLRAKDCHIRHILDNRSDVRLTSQFILTETMVSYK
jgi:hypothetical protein